MGNAWRAPLGFPLRAKRARRHPPAPAWLKQRTLSCEHLESRLALAAVNVTFEFSAASAPNTPLSELAVDNDYVMKVFVQDNRGASASGIFQAYFDMTYDADLLDVVGAIAHGTQYDVRALGSFPMDGEIDAAGGTASSVPSPPGGKFLLFSVPIRTEDSGTLSIAAQPDNNSDNQVEFFTSTQPITDIQFIGSTINIQGAAVIVTPTSGLITTEAGGTAAFNVSLTQQPTADVTINLSSSDTTEGTVVPSSLTFTPGNWNVPQTVTVTGANDVTVDGSIGYTIVTAAAVSTDSRYSGLAVADVSVTNQDNDAAGFTVDQTGGSTQVSESGTTDTFSVVLSAQPLSNVVLDVSSADVGEASVAPAQLTFTPANWNVPQTVTVTGVNDDILDGSQATLITLAVNDALSDNAFDPLANQTVSASTSDNDVAGFTVVQSGGSTQVSESGTTDSFTVVLTAQPSTSVVLDVSSGDTGEATVAPAKLTFTPANWNVPQPVTVTGVNDDLTDGNQATLTTVAVNDALSDNSFDAVLNQTVSVTTSDNDVPGFAVVESGGSTQVSEAGTTDTFSVVLIAQPTSNVVLDVTSADTGEATVTPAQLTFTPGDWNVPQTVTVTGVNDNLVDGSQTANITVAVNDAASDNSFDPVANQTVSATTTDNDVVGFTVTQSDGSTQVSESGTSDTFSVVLNAQPNSNVVLSISSGDVGEATVAQAQLTFTAANWNVPQTVTVTGVNDNLVDGGQATVITLAVNDAASDNNFDPVADQTVSVTTSDNDTAGFTVTQSGGSTQVSESGTTDTISVVLTAQPSASVVIDVSSADTGEATAGPAQLTFTPANWNTPQSVTVTGVNDFLVDGSQATLITLAVNDAASDDSFDPLANQTVSVSTSDNDAAGFTVTPTGGSTQVSESGTTDTFSVVLSAQPNSNVVLDVSSADTGEATATPAQLTFTPANWNVPQNVTVTGVNDFLVDGSQATLVTLAINDAASDNSFDPLANQTVSVSTSDNDTAGFTVTQSGGSTQVSETGTTDTVSVVLTAQPNSNVVLTVTSGDTGEATVTPAQLTFTSANWNVPQTVTVTGIDDFLLDGNQNAVITLAVNDATSDNNFDPLANQTVSATTTDNDTAGFTVTQTGGSTQVNETGTTDTFSVVLAAQPNSNVVLTVTSGDTGEATAAPAQLTFTPANWNVPQTVTVTGADDALVDGPQTTTITLAVNDAASDNNFDPLANQTVSATTTDDEQFVVRIVRTGDGNEAGLVSGAFSVSLSAATTSETRVSYQVTGTAASGADFSPLSGTVTIPAGQLSTPIGVSVLEDNQIEGAETVVVTLTTIDAGDPRLEIDATGNTASLSITDSESGLVSVAATTSGNETGPISAVFTVTQGGVATADTVVNVSLSGAATTGDFTPPAATVTIPAGQTSATITVPIVNDGVVESNESLVVTITLGAHSPLVALNAAQAQATGSILDNDSAQVSIAAAAGGSESGSSSGKFTITQTAPSSVDTTVSYSVAGTAASGDRGPLSGSVVIPAGQTTADVIVTVVDDGIVEATESVSLEITGVSGAALVTVESAQDTASIDIADNDTALVSIAAQAAGNETGPVAGSLLVSLTGPSSTATTIAFHAAGTATSGDDFAALPTSVTIPAGELTATVNVPVLDDNRFEGVENVEIILDAITAGDAQISLSPTAAAASISIADNETGLLRIAATTGGDESGPTSGRFTVTQGGTSATDTVVALLVDGTAAAGSDFDALPATVTIPAGSTSATIDVMVSDDELIEGLENVRVTLGNIQSGQSGLAKDPAASVATVNIADDDVAHVSIELTASTAEGGAAGSFTVGLDRTAAVDTLVAYTIGGSAVAGDFAALTGAATILAGQSSVSIPITPVNDATVESTETVSLTLVSTTPGAPGVLIDATRNTATLEIADNDVAQAGIAATTAASEAGATHGLFTVTLSAPSATSTTLAYTVSGTAGAGDFTPLAGSITIPAGATSATIDVSPTDDLAVEGQETIVVTLTSITSGDPQIAINPTAAAATLQLADNDSATIAFVTASSSVLESSGSHSLQVRLTLPAGGQLARPVTINIANAGTGTASAGDFTLATTSITFAAGSLPGDTRTINLTLTSDNVNEGDETLPLALTIASDGTGGRASLAAPSQHVVTITDDPLTASLAGVVWVDANGNGRRDTSEITVPGVTVRLTGTGRAGQAVSKTLTTDKQGAYQFKNLPGGTYALVEQQPVALVDGVESRGTVGGSLAGTMGNDRITAIALPPGASGQAFNFGERGLKAKYVTARSFVLSVMARNKLLQDIVATTERAAAAATASQPSSLASLPVTPATNSTGGEGEAPAARSLPLSTTIQAAAAPTASSTGAFNSTDAATAQATDKIMAEEAWMEPPGTDTAARRTAKRRDFLSRTK